MDFRKDINGLRAIAVMAVVLFHFNKSWLPGGFVGVDVFFVISGFLMTKIIIKGFSDNSFSLGRFYYARAKRIVPALFALCMLLSVVGWLILTPSDYITLGKHASSSMLFFSNFTYWHESGYFDAPSQNKWLLHTWSLSVEWQFYLLYPILLGLIKRFTKIDKIKYVLLVGTLLGFIVSVVATHMWPVSSYFLLPTRAWQMAFGGVAFLFPLSLQPKHAFKIEWVGHFLIIMSCLFISQDFMWPGYWAFIPVFGAFCIIQANNQESIITGNKLFQYIGMCSYSIYLIHWPIIVAAKKMRVELNIVSYALLVFTLSVLFYRFIEKKRNVNWKWASAALLVSILIYTNDGFMNRVSPEFQFTNKQYHRKYYGGAGYPADEVFYLNSTENDYSLIFTGDSFGLQYSKSLEERNVKVAGLFDHGCFILPNYTRYRFNAEDIACSNEYPKLMGLLNQNTSIPVFIAHNWDYYQDKLIKKGGSYPCELSKEEFYKVIKSELEQLFEDGGHSRSYFIVGVPPETDINAFDCLAQKDLYGVQFLSPCETEEKEKVHEINELLQSISMTKDNVYFVNPNDALCDNGMCSIIIDDQPVYSDGSHLSVYGAGKVADLILKTLDDATMSVRNILAAHKQ